MIIDTNFYEAEIVAIKQELKKLPESHLTRKGRFYYEMMGTYQRGITKDRQKIKKLVRKAYLLKRLGYLEWNFSLIKKLSHRFKPEDPAKIIKDLPALYQMTPADYFYHSSVHDQIENPAKGNAGYTDGLIYVTDSGLHVRSKSERTIADALDRYKITYRYEETHTFGGVNIHPDFTIYRPSDGRMFLWEHLGLFDQDEYRQKTIEKLFLYSQNGFFPFVNMIYTCEQDLRNPSQVYAIIEMFFLLH